MGVIRFTQKDLDRNRPFEPGWKKCEVVGMAEKLSKKKDSINRVVSFKVGLGEDDERSYDHTFSEKALGMMEPFIAAALNVVIDAETDYDESLLIGKQLWIEFTKEIYKDANNPNDRGRPVNRAIAFASLDNPPF